MFFNMSKSASGLDRNSSHLTDRHVGFMLNPMIIKAYLWKDRPLGRVVAGLMIKAALLLTEHRIHTLKMASIRI
jgi:hypothetical protein